MRFVLAVFMLIFCCSFQQPSEHSIPKFIEAYNKQDTVTLKKMLSPSICLKEVGMPIDTISAGAFIRSYNRSWSLNASKRLISGVVKKDTIHCVEEMNSDRIKLLYNQPVKLATSYLFKEDKLVYLAVDSIYNQEQLAQKSENKFYEILRWLRENHRDNISWAAALKAPTDNNVQDLIQLIELYNNETED